MTYPLQQGLYAPQFEHDSCGVGFIVNIDGEQSHDIVTDGLTILKNLVHRGAVGGDLKTGDGAGMLIQIPHFFFAKAARSLRFSLPEAGAYGVGFFFLPQEVEICSMMESVTGEIIAKEGGQVLGWREVPVNRDCLGELALAAMPCLKQAFVAFHGLSGDTLQRRLYVVRKCIEKAARDKGLTMNQFYIPSLSCRTITYKGMFDAPRLEQFYRDFDERDFESALAVVHQRYSTNTFPSWALAQPMRYIAHNGEINTLRGNINKMNAREKTLCSPLFGDDITKLFPVIVPGGSDSGTFDNAFELLVSSGRSLEHVMMMMIPEAFGPAIHMSTDKRAFYEYHATIMEPWDGPAAMAFTDGFKVGATLDRNGLRPARYVITKQGRVILASEVGVVPVEPADVLEKGRLAPGKMLIVDTVRKRVIKDNEIKASVCRHKPYRHWLEQNRIELKGFFQVPGMVPVEEKKSLATQQQAFGYTLEEVEKIVAPMAETAQEPVGSMGNDEALAVLSERPQLLFKYFKQLFAQVTNPPVDPYRENLVMSVMAFTGKERNLLEETPEHCHQIKLLYPVLTNEDMEKLRYCEIPDFSVTEVSTLFPVEDAEQGMHERIKAMCRQAEEAIDAGTSLIILSDRWIDCRQAAVPALLATSAVHHHLVRAGKRHLGGLVIETGEARDVMHFATLVGYGASAVNPYLCFKTIAALKNEGKLPEGLTLPQAIENYITAVKKGLLKIMSKMGISTIRSYKSAQLFEAVGLNRDFIDAYFPGTPSRIGGIGLEQVARETIMRHQDVFIRQTDNGRDLLPSGGSYHFRRFSEKHLLTPEAIACLQKALREGSYDQYKKYAAMVNGQAQNLCTLRGLFKFKKGRPVPLEDVEPVDSIVKRFVSSAMSLGSISKEAHEAIAIAMNRLGAQSNSGEGGEDEVRYEPLPGGDSSMSAIKQVASARFGVTSNYLAHARELQIKMAQGAKPGEGGQLPGHKVTEMIARVRHSTPGVMLISPPPHHDIYSIEDLAQLIYDLKNANPQARVSVKLVSEVGVGTVAAGVAKGKADMVLVSGHDGGTGASPISSIKYAGMPWEVGLAETQQTLVLNKLRDRIRVQVDGQLRTGRDVVIGALLGAEEFGFGTVVLVTMGCIMARKCHLDACPVGVASQDERLRSRFRGRPEHLMNFMRYVAQDVREIMSFLGFSTIDEMVGRVDMLEADEAVGHWKTHGLDFSGIFHRPDIAQGKALRCTRTQEHDFSHCLDFALIEKSREALADKKPVQLQMQVRNRNRSVGAMLSCEVSRRYGSAGLPRDTIWTKFTGSAGQSFGAFLAPGITFELEGDANDYLGKGLSGGRIILYPPAGSTYRPQNNIITGNVALFGATGGEIFIHGQAGERFAVRNSGATAVVEGVGDHGCEYMTGGRVIILGPTGINFAAGMSGGIAYVLDANQLFDTRCNLEMVDLSPVEDAAETQYLYDMIKRHADCTGSRHAESILNDWPEMLPYFVKVMPMDYRKALDRIKQQSTRESEHVIMTEEVFR
jgi:glutamate synthase domain-containing protein 2/glutamate synthase domain-containing protein 1/glutamate synthase domain-containing protein 3